MAQDELTRFRELRAEVEKNTAPCYDLYDSKVQSLERELAEQKAEAVNGKMLRYTVVSAVSAVIAAVVSIIGAALAIYFNYHPH